MRFVAGKETPRESGKGKPEKNGAAASGIRRDRTASVKKRAMSKTPNKKLQPRRVAEGIDGKGGETNLAVSADFNVER
jgi:hypothetical protein